MWFALLWACAAAAPTCVPVAQLSGAQTVGTAASGWEYCTTQDGSDQGSFRRVDAVACAYGNAPLPCDQGTTETGGCDPGDVYASDGYGCSCVTPCTTDADCGSGEICACASGLGIHGSFRELGSYDVCRPASCTTGADCDGRDCSLAIDACGGWDELACHSAGDECATDDQCTQQVGGYCSLSDGDWTCGEMALCD